METLAGLAIAVSVVILFFVVMITMAALAVIGNIIIRFVRCKEHMHNLGYPSKKGQCT